MSRRSFSIPLAPVVKFPCFHKEITCHNTPKTSVNSAAQLSKCCFFALFSEAFPLCNAKENTVSWKELSWVFLLLSTTGHIGKLFADGHMLCSLLMKTPQATFWEVHCTGRSLYWKLKQQRLLKSASGTMTQSWQLIIHGAFTTHALAATISQYLPLSLHFYFSLFAYII